MERGFWGLATPYIRAGRMGALPRTPRGTHGWRGGQGISAPTSSFIFINTCKFQEPFNMQRHPVEPHNPAAGLIPVRRGVIAQEERGDTKRLRDFSLACARSKNKIK